MEELFLVVRKKSSVVFKISWPMPAEMRESAALLEANREHGHLLRGVFGITDDSRMPCAHYINRDLQNAF